MNWGSAQEFFAMGGYGLYVWGSTVVVFLGLGAELMSLKLRRRAALIQANSAGIVQKNTTSHLRSVQ